MLTTGILEREIIVCMTKLWMFYNGSTLIEKSSEKMKMLTYWFINSFINFIIILCIDNFLPACPPALRKQVILFFCSKSVTRNGNVTERHKNRHTIFDDMITTAISWTNTIDLNEYYNIIL